MYRLDSGLAQSLWHPLLVIFYLPRAIASKGTKYDITIHPI
jgi:hypothetical protein